MSDIPPFEFETLNDVIIISPTRNVSTLAEQTVDTQLAQIKTTLAENGIKKVLFDLGKIDYFGSAMLEAMLSIWKFLGSKDHQIAFCSVNETSRQVLQISKFDTVWDIFDNRDEALASFN